MTRVFPLAILALGALGCNKASDEDVVSGLSVLGDGTHDISDRLEIIGVGGDGLAKPTDLAFNPEVPGELWVTNKKDDSMSIFDGAGTGGQSSENIVDPYALHFMDAVTSIAFGAPGTFATCHDSVNDYNGSLPGGNDFMGPTLWSSDRAIFGETNPQAVEYLSEMFGSYTDLGSHLDMLHESPHCMGIAWDRENIYWVFDGENQAIGRYDFQEDHGIGYDDHSDGIIQKWGTGQFKRVAGVVSHLVLDHDSGLLYIADTGNNRIAVLDTNSGSEGDSLPVMELGTQHHKWKGADIQTLVDGESLGMQAPAGIALHAGLLYVTDNGTSRVHAFDLTGEEIDYAETSLESGSLQGIIATSPDELWVIDGNDKKVLRIQ